MARRLFRCFRRGDISDAQSNSFTKQMMAFKRRVTKIFSWCICTKTTSVEIIPYSVGGQIDTASSASDATSHPEDDDLSDISDALSCVITNSAVDTLQTSAEISTDNLTVEDRDVVTHLSLHAHRPSILSNVRVDVPQYPEISDVWVDVPQYPETSDGRTQGAAVIEINSCSYEICMKLREEAYGRVYEGKRLTDGQKVTLKFVKDLAREYTHVEGYSEAVPLEIGLLILASKGTRVSQITQLLYWQVKLTQYAMVLEHSAASERLNDFLDRHGGTVKEDVAAVIMQKATFAAQTCCKRGVFHGNINLTNLLIDPETHDICLTDFGCGKVLTRELYSLYLGTVEYWPPEYDVHGRFHGKQATSWSLGIVMYFLLCGKFPESEDFRKLNQNIWSKDTLTEDCCKLLCSLLQRDPKKRLKLEKILFHHWFEYFGFEQESKEIDVNSCNYKIGKKLGEGGFGSVYEGVRLTDGLKVALKFASNSDIEYIEIEEYSEVVPREIGLLILANKGDRVPQIIQLLDWKEDTDEYIMVLEFPVPCETLDEFLNRHEGTITEDVAVVIMQQATLAAQTCCKRGVLHRDIKLENLLINPDTSEVKLIDFGCGELLTSSPYAFYSGTQMYAPPEFSTTGEYHGNPATVWSLGILLFELLCGQFPTSDELDELNEKTWTRDNLSEDCCELLCSLLQNEPENRRKLEKILFHSWFQYFGLEQKMPENIDVNSCNYKIGKSLGEGGFGNVYEGVRLTDGLQVALKFASNSDIEYIEIEGYSEAVPREIGLLILANKGDRVPQIIQLLDWKEDTDEYIMVLEFPVPCESLDEFLSHHGGTITEDVAAVIMQQATLAAQTCCQRGVLHRDIKLENLLINPETREVKLIDFGCGELLTSSPYTFYCGTEVYIPPEYYTTGEYHGKPVTVWSLGMVMYALLCGQFPKSDELDELNDNTWTRDDLSPDCSKLLCLLLQRLPENRRKLEKILFHSWFQYFGLEQKMPENIDVNSCNYKIGKSLGEGGFGNVYEGIRLTDGLQVALKFASNTGIEYIEIEGYSEAVPLEIGLLILANKGDRVPQIIQLLDWKDDTDDYIMVLEFPVPCESLDEFLSHHGGTITEDVAAVIMQQATLAAQTCCQRGVLHRDIKLENLLINPETREVKLIDFGCGELLTSSPYTFYCGTEVYIPPEYYTTGEYHGKPVTVWSLGMVMYALLCGQFPKSDELDELNDNTWTRDDLSPDCCKLLCLLLQRLPENRRKLEKILFHSWFQFFGLEQKMPENIDVNSCNYKIGKSLGEGGFGNVYEGIRLTDGLQVALKFASNTGIEYIEIEGYSEAVPLEIGLLILANKGDRVPQIIQLLDWKDDTDDYIMVLEFPVPCESLDEFLSHHGGTITEDVAAVIMKQTTLAAQTCCQRGVLHRDIKLENLLINPETREVKLIDFGCGKLLTSSPYTFYCGTEVYIPPEYYTTGEYHGKPITVWSLGMIMYALLCGQFPNSDELDELNDNTWTRDDLSPDCCKLLCLLLQRLPENRRKLEKILFHNWFQYFGLEQKMPENIDVNSCNYKIGKSLGEGGFGNVYEGIRLTDGLQVALKFASNTGIEYIEIEGYSEAVPLEIGLLILANKGDRVPQIIQLLDWKDDTDDYIMVLEFPVPCESLDEFLSHHGGTITEDVAAVIMKQTTLAAQTCCQRGVLHRDIKLENLLINPETREVKLIDFGCGKLLTSSPYTFYCGTEVYIPPEYYTTGEYHGKPITVWSLGMVMYALLCGQFPNSDELDELNDNTWTRDDLSPDCCKLLCSLLQREPEQRLDLEKVNLHLWFQSFNLVIE